MIESFGVIVALVKRFPEEMKKVAGVLKRRLETMLSSRDSKLESLAFETIDEYSRVCPSTPFKQFIVSIIKDFIKLKN